MGDADHEETAKPSVREYDDRLESWKEIAAYLRKDVSTAQRWEKRAGLPVHRPEAGGVLNVFAYRSEIDAWRNRSRSPTVTAQHDSARAEPDGTGSLAPGRVPLAWAAGAVVVLAVAGVWVFGPGQRPGNQAVIDAALVEGSYVLVARFENLTPIPLFDDGALEAAFGLALSDSAFLHVASPERVDDALRLMQRPAGSALDRDTAREVALRDGGIAVVLAGRVEAFDDDFRLTVQLLDPATDRVFGHFQERASNEAEVGPAIHRLASRIREGLGEALPLAGVGEQRLQKVTTPSLRALQLYSRGYELQRNPGDGDLAAAEELHRLAVAEDPSFAAAHIMLAWTIRNQGRPSEEYLPHAEQAAVLAGSGTAEDRLFIEGSYLTLTGQHAQAASKYEALLALNPAHHYALNNLRYSHQQLGWPEPVEFIARQATLRPNDSPRQLLAAKQLVLAGRLDDAAPFVARVKELATPDTLDPWMVFLPAYESWIADDVDSVYRTLKSTGRSMPSEARQFRNIRLMYAGVFHLALGQLDQAEEAFDAINGPARYGLLSDLALGTDDEPGFQEHFDALIEGFHASSGVRQPEQERLLKVVHAGLPLDPADVDAAPEFQRQLAYGELAFRRGDVRQAVQMLQDGLRSEPRTLDFFLASESLAEAWQRLGAHERAVRILEEAALTEAPYGNLTVRQMLAVAGGRFRVQARLAREYRALGRIDDATALEEHVLRMLKYADDDHPVVAQILASQAGSR